MSNLVNFSNAETFPVNGIQSYSPKNNNSQIVFDIAGGANQMLDMASLRLVFTLRVLDGAGTQRPNNGDVLTTGAVQIQMDSRTGVTGIYQNITFMDQNNNVLESVNNMGRLMATVMPNTMSRDDYNVWSNMRYGAYGARQDQQDIAVNADIPQCQKLYTGLTLSKPMPFSVVGKLKLQISLANSNQVLFGAQASANTGATYELRDVKLTYRVLNLPQPVSLPKTGYGFRHFGSFNQTINAQDYQNQYNFNTGNTLAVINTFIPSTHVNNYNHNSFETNKLTNKVGANYTTEQNINNSSFLKNSLRNPLDFEVDERVYNDRNDGKVSYDAQRSYYYMDALRPYYQLNHTLLSPASENLGGGYNSSRSTDNGVEVYGLGIRYDQAQMMAGSNFSAGNTYLQRIRSGLDGQSPNEIYSYVYSMKRLVPTPNGAVVV